MVGGAAGALLRWSLGLLIVSPSGGFPVATFVVNMTGAFGLGVAGVIFAERMPPIRFLRELIAIGFFGAYTTFSTMALEGVRLVESGKIPTAMTYWVLTLIVGQMAGISGMWLGRFETRGGRHDEARG